MNVRQENSVQPDLHPVLNVEQERSQTFIKLDVVSNLNIQTYVFKNLTFAN